MEVFNSVSETPSQDTKGSFCSFLDVLWGWKVTLFDWPAIKSDTFPQSHMFGQAIVQQAKCWDLTVEIDKIWRQCQAMWTGHYILPKVKELIDIESSPGIFLIMKILEPKDLITKYIFCIHIIIKDSFNREEWRGLRSSYLFNQTKIDFLLTVKIWYTPTLCNITLQ